MPDLIAQQENLTDSRGSITAVQIEHEATGTVEDITTMVRSIAIYEDIFSPYMSANVLVQDITELIYRLPLAGGENILIEYIDVYNNTTNKFEFVINSISEQIESGREDRVFVIECSSRHAIFVDQMYRDLDYYEGNYVEIAKEIHGKYYANYVDLVVGGISAGRDIVYGANMTPGQIMTMCAESAMSVESNIPDFMFFQTRKGLHFQSFNNIIKEAKKTQNVLATYRRYDTPRLSELTSEQKIHTILGKVEKSIHPVSKHLQRGTPFFRLLDISIYGKMTGTSEKMDTAIYVPNYRENHEKMHKYPIIELEKNTPINSRIRRDTGITRKESKSLRSGVIPTMYGDITTVKGFESDMAATPIGTDSKHRGLRKSFLDTLTNNLWQLNVPGQSFLNPGIPLKIDYQTSETVKNRTRNNHLSGTYIISSVSHVIGSDDSYQCNVELIKDSSIVPYYPESKETDRRITDWSGGLV